MCIYYVAISGGGRYSQASRERKVITIKYQYQFLTFSNKGVLHAVSHPRLYFYLQCSFFIH